MSKKVETFEILEDEKVIGFGSAFYRDEKLNVLTEKTQLAVFKTEQEAKSAAMKFLQ